MTASINDVAKLAGVSVATVSRALRDLPNVAARTRSKVLDAAAELDYVVNPNASRLAAGHNHTIGVVVPFIANWYFQEVMAGAQAVLEEAGYDTLMYNISAAAARERFLTLLPFRKRVDGILLVDLPMSDAEMEVLSQAGTSIAAVGFSGGLYPGVHIDNHGAAKRATEYLLDLGHRKVGLMATGLRYRVSVQRRKGWVDALRGRGIEPGKSWEYHADFSMRGGAEGLHEMLAAEPDITAIFCMSDEMAMGVLKAIRERGLRCPEDISVIGFDGHEVCEYVGLTTVVQPMRLLGQTAAEILIDSARGEEVSVRAHRLPTSLVVRDSTATAP